MWFFSAILAGLLTNNVVFSQGIGICSFVSVTNNSNKAFKLGLATAFVLVCSVMVLYPINMALTALDIEYLRLIVSIIIIASLVQCAELFIKKVSPRLHAGLGIYLPLITTNCIVMGTVLLVLGGSYGFLRATVTALAAGLGYILALFILSSVRQKTNSQKAPAAAMGLPIVLILCAFIAMAFELFKGM